MKNALMNPCGTFEVGNTALTPRPHDLRGKVIGFLCNDKKNADELLKNFQSLLEDKYEGLEFIWLHKSASEPAIFTEDFLTRSNVAIAAFAD